MKSLKEVTDIVIGERGYGEFIYTMGLIMKAYEEGRPVYCTFDTPYSKKIDVKDFGKYSFPSDSLIVLGDYRNGIDLKDFTIED